MWEFLLAFNKEPSIIQHLGAPPEFLMETSFGKPSAWQSDQNSNKIHEKHWFYLAKSLENIGVNKRIGENFW